MLFRLQIIKPIIFKLHVTMKLIKAINDDEDDTINVEDFKVWRRETKWHDVGYVIS